MRFPVGKIPLGVLDALLKRNLIQDERVIVGPAVGEDAAVIDTGGVKYLIAKTDPITFATDDIGWYAVNINANDIATMGGCPKWFLATLLLPENMATKEYVERIFQQVLDSCHSLGVSLVGGHTEVTHDINRPIIIGQMLGEVEKKKLVRTDGAREGDAIILTKGIAVEGTAILAREKKEEIARVFGAEMLSRCKNFLFRPGVSVLKEALIAGETAQVHSMHDPTEGGLATALHEIAWAAKVGLVVDAAAINVYSETRRFCEYYHLDPMGLIASGALLIVVAVGEVDKVITELHQENVPAAVIGRVVCKNEGIKVRTPSGLHDLPLFEQDELTKVCK